MKIERNTGSSETSGCRDGEPALEHVLHEAGGLEADRLAARIGPRNDKGYACGGRAACRAVRPRAPAPAGVCCRSGWRAFFSTSRSSSEMIGFTQPFCDAQRPLAHSMSISAGSRPTRRSARHRGRTESVNSERMRTISRRSAYSSSRSSLLISTTSTGST